ncbi:hypothetical protein NDU88_003224 [Pleurodeles waltl]|uniref:Uncharacterized protein n=1 Tax=Pleurodeles waltl TaxID=8319 RepID=A0AAV7SE66_PLEWA|nr:hypothetical protein NDU88_003224 [Pleurodeles waltl]
MRARGDTQIRTRAEESTAPLMIPGERRGGAESWRRGPGGNAPQLGDDWAGCRGAPEVRQVDAAPALL